MSTHALSHGVQGGGEDEAVEMRRRKRESESETERESERSKSAVCYFSPIPSLSSPVAYGPARPAAHSSCGRAFLTARCLRRGAEAEGRRRSMSWVERGERHLSLSLSFSFSTNVGHSGVVDKGDDRNRGRERREGGEREGEREEREVRETHTLSLCLRFAHRTQEGARQRPCRPRGRQ